MAKSRNVITHGMSGMIGDTIVFRQLKDGTITVSNRPKATNKPPSAQQQQVRTTFQQAVLYGHAATSDAVTKAAYEASAKGNQNAFNVAVADFFHAPDIHGVDLSGYTGAKDEKIIIHASDDFMVAGVHVKIENSNNSLVEEGDAALDPTTGHWIYITTAANATLSGDKITITATDTPGHHTTNTQTL